ncbi:MAG TPA: glycoside hydrolase family 57 protein [Terriglobia bacterium]|nr:glycoside hydrolase family 57 protein [Terriglobia bacterium]
MPTLVSFLWHMHQPFYKDVVGNSYVMPWAYLHATKDYLGMANLSGEFPEVHQTFNLVPSLVLQLDDYARGEARDPLFDLAFAPAEELGAVGRELIVTKFFPVPRTMIEPYPRYAELRGRREESLTIQELRDIQVWWTLAWMDQGRRPATLVEKGRDFSLADQGALRELVLQTIRDVVPAYRRHQEQGTIEISTTPFYHPILPILVNSRVDDAGVPVDFQFPEDALEQLRRARAFITDRFGRAPRGLWPSEGSVSEGMAELVAQAGFEWMATDEGILEKSGVHVYDGSRHRLYQPYRRNNITIFFRDRTLSDLIGFQYMHGAARDSANDLLRRLKEIPQGSHVSIILDGENPWDYYPDSGRDFLRFVFDGIQQYPALEGVTLSEARDRLTPATLDWLAPGSWAGANFGIWMGHPEDHEAWAWIVRARESLMDMKDKVLQSSWDMAHEELLVAEGSDWMWWFGNDFTSDDDAVFDTLFRRHIGNIYCLLGLPEPDALARPIKKSLGSRVGTMFQGT